MVGVFSTEDGRIRSARSIGVGEEPSFVATTDLDGDGRTDRVTGVVDGVSILRGASGHAAFDLRETIAFTRGTCSFALGDFDEDGTPDLAAVGAADDALWILRGTGTGSFEVASSLVVSEPGEGVLARDLDRDGDLDLAVSFPFAGEVRLFLGDGEGGFEERMTIRAGPASPRPG